MLGSYDIAAFVPTKDSQKARSFYEGVLGLRFIKDDGFALVLDANGIMLRVSKAPEFKPAPFTVLGWKSLASRKWSRACRKRVSSLRDSVFSSKTNSEFGPLPPATKLPGLKIPMATSCQFQNTCDLPRTDHAEAKLFQYLGSPRISTPMTAYKSPHARQC